MSRVSRISRPRADDPRGFDTGAVVVYNDITIEQ
jgi:hypothetical protein